MAKDQIAINPDDVIDTINRLQGFLDSDHTAIKGTEEYQISVQLLAMGALFAKHTENYPAEHKAHFEKTCVEISKHINSLLIE